MDGDFKGGPFEGPSRFRPPSRGERGNPGTRGHGMRKSGFWFERPLPAALPLCRCVATMEIAHRSCLGLSRVRLVSGQHVREGKLGMSAGVCM